MKVLFDNPMPFQLAHGGAQTQIEETIQAVSDLGVEVEPLRWWDDRQTGDFVHYFGRPNGLYARLVKARGRKLVISELLTGQASWGAMRRLPNRLIRRANIWLGRRMSGRLGWDAYRQADAILALTPWEARLVTELYDAPPEVVKVVPNGVQEEFFSATGGEDAPETRSDYLVCTATITERKRVVELAEAAVQSRVPVLVVGKPYTENDPYFLKFLSLHRQNPDLVRYEGPVYDRQRLAGIYRRARGFVLVSSMESLSLSALEAAATGCPLLLGDLPWARCTFGASASYCPISSVTSVTARHLKDFHTRAPSLPRPARPKTWREIGKQIKSVYDTLLAGR